MKRSDAVKADLAHVKTPRVCIVSLTKVTQEPRVLRQIRTLQQKGWNVAVVGYADGSDVPADWDFLEVDVGHGNSKAAPRIRSLLVRNPIAAVKRIARIVDQTATPLLARLSALATVTQHQVKPDWTIEKARRHFERDHSMTALVARMMKSIHKCDLVIAHDYYTYFLADALAQRDGARIAIDCHEYALEQYDERSHFDRRMRNTWRYVTKPYIDALQRHFFVRAHAVSTVCDGIADLLQADYQLPRRPVVVRSTPFYEATPFRPCGEHIEIVYHGLVSPTRNLDTALRTLALCRPEFCLTVRGPVTPGYDLELQTLAEQLGVEQRFRIKPPVPFDQIVQSASQADIGYFVFANFSRQRQFTAPNKFFEYMMAGLALVVSDVPELSRIVRAHANGLLVGEFTPEAAASAINSLTRSEIDRMKRQSLAAAKELCWEHEQAKLIEAYGL